MTAQFFCATTMMASMQNCAFQEFKVHEIQWLTKMLFLSACVRDVLEHDINTKKIELDMRRYQVSCYIINAVAHLSKCIAVAPSYYLPTDHVCVHRT